MFEDLDLNYNVVGVALGFWVMFIYLLWWLPQDLGLGENSLLVRIGGTILGLPLSYFVVNWIANK